MHNPPVKSKDIMHLYFDEVKNSSPLTGAREKALASRIQQGDIQARNELVQANLRFVIDVAKGYQHRGLSLDELISAGNLGLVKAADRFDGTKGFKFISYAVWWIRQAILEVLGENQMVRLPINKQSLVNSIAKVSRKIAQRTGNAALLTDIAAELDLPLQEVEDTVRSVSTMRSLDEELNDRDSLCLLDLLAATDQDAPDMGVADESWRRALASVLDCLDAREQYILRHYYGLDNNEQHNLEQLGELLGITRERVRQIKELALSKLRHPSRLRRLYDLGYN